MNETGGQKEIYKEGIDTKETGRTRQSAAQNGMYGEKRETAMVTTGLFLMYAQAQETS